MKFKNPLLAVQDMERSKEFYRQVLGLHVVVDFGANVTLTGGVCLQTLDTWREFLHAEPGQIAFGGCDAELYFEEDDFDGFIAKLTGKSGVELVHPVSGKKMGFRVVPKNPAFAGFAMEELKKLTENETGISKRG